MKRRQVAAAVGVGAVIAALGLWRHPSPDRPVRPRSSSPSSSGDEATAATAGASSSSAAAPTE